MYSPNLKSGWGGVHVAKEVKLLSKKCERQGLDGEIDELVTLACKGSEWWDLCAGPHVESTDAINKKAVELETVVGAYWRGDEKRPMLQRIYGTVWENEEQQKEYIILKRELNNKMTDALA